VLEVTPEAETSQIKKSYINLMMANHPDKHSKGTDDQKNNAIEATKKITAAWEILKDDSIRRAFDQGGHGAVHSVMEENFVYDPDPSYEEEE